MHTKRPSLAEVNLRSPSASGLFLFLYFFDMDPCGLSQVMNENEYVQLLAADNERCNSVS